MKVELGCGIGFQQTHKSTIEIDDSELEGKTEDEIDDYITEEYAVPFANEYLEVWWSKK